jgi:MFS family permease
MLASVSDILPENLRPKGTAAATFLYDLGWSAAPQIIGILTTPLGQDGAFRALSVFIAAVMASLFIFYWAPERFRENARR